MTRKDITISIVDDDNDLREKIAVFIGATPGFRCLSQYESAEEALANLPKDKPEVILMDINLEGTSGIDCVRNLKPLLPKSQFLMLTVFEDTKKILRAIAAGASGYLLKRMPPEKLVEAIHEVYEGGSPMSPSIARTVIHLLRSMPQAAESVESLTDRQREVLDGLAAGRAYKQIADEMGMSIHTVRTYIRRIYEKLHVHSRTEAVAKYLRQ
jgi:DNA-binding NarL/FixJ family response regulator